MSNVTQDEAYQLIHAWACDTRNSQRVVRLGGLAGTGKTTLVKRLAKAFEFQIPILAYTNKAVHVLRSKGVVNAQTIHSRLYTGPGGPDSNSVSEAWETALRRLAADPRSDSLKREYYRQNDLRKHVRFSFGYRSIEVPKGAPAFLIVDEASMVSAKILHDIQSAFAGKILLVGDYGQLPPIREVSVLGEHNLDLTLAHIYRQQHGSKIIQIAYEARETGMLPKIAGGLDILGDTLDDIVLCHSNATRGRLNRQIRDHLGYDTRDDAFCLGEIILCHTTDKRQNVLNGCRYKILETVNLGLRLDYTVMTDGVSPRNIYYEGPLSACFTNGYVCTVHKAQGSEFSSVRILDDFSRRLARKNPELRKQWAYTAVTRAKENLFIE